MSEEVTAEDVSPEIQHRSLAEALVAFQAEVGSVAKDADNPFFKSKYADLPAVKRAAQPILAKHGLAVVQEPSYVVLGEKIYDTLVTTVISTWPGDGWGSPFRSTMVLKPVKNDPQAQGSAITYARRYAFMAVLGLVADDDDDGNAASAKGKVATRSRVTKPTPDEEGNADVRQAIAAVKAAAKDAGVTPKAATEYFAKENDGASLINSTDLAALVRARDHFLAIVNGAE